MQSGASIAEQKASLRARLKDLRAGLSATQRAEDSRAMAHRLLQLEPVKLAHSFFVYISCGSEPDTHEIIRCLLAQGKLVTVPKISESRRMQAQRFTSWDQLHRGQLGILTPTNGTEYDGVIDITVTPGLGFTPKGHRIGFGAGYYDQWFATHVTRLKIALAYEVQIRDEIPVDERDVAVDMILTEQRMIAP